MIQQKKTAKTVGVIKFPGSNCDQDLIDVLSEILHLQVVSIDYREEKLPKVDAIIIPGGFSYGDYLRAGALAAHSPIMKQVIGFAQNGGKVLGICNGFQILTESRLLPGTLLRNASQNFICKKVFLSGANGTGEFSEAIKGKNPLKMTIAHGEGRYYIDPDGLAELKGQGQIVLQYSNDQGEIVAEDNPNGSLENIAGVRNKAGNVIGLMPHPERACYKEAGGLIDGQLFLTAFLSI